MKQQRFNPHTIFFSLLPSHCTSNINAGTMDDSLSFRGAIIISLVSSQKKALFALYMYIATEKLITWKMDEERGSERTHQWQDEAVPWCVARRKKNYNLCVWKNKKFLLPYIQCRCFLLYLTRLLSWQQNILADEVAAAADADGCNKHLSEFSLEKLQIWLLPLTQLGESTLDFESYLKLPELLTISTRTDCLFAYCNSNMMCVRSTIVDYQLHTAASDLALYLLCHTSSLFRC